jgi:hypothetical protein
MLLQIGRNLGKINDFNLGGLAIRTGHPIVEKGDLAEDQKCFDVILKIVSESNLSRERKNEISDRASRLRNKELRLQNLKNHIDEALCSLLLRKSEMPISDYLSVMKKRAGTKKESLSVAGLEDEMKTLQQQLDQEKTNYYDLQHYSTNLRIRIEAELKLNEAINDFEKAKSAVSIRVRFLKITSLLNFLTHNHTERHRNHVFFILLLWAIFASVRSFYFLSTSDFLITTMSSFLIIFVAYLLLLKVVFRILYLPINKTYDFLTKRIKTDMVKNQFLEKRSKLNQLKSKIEETLGREKKKNEARVYETEDRIVEYQRNINELTGVAKALSYLVDEYRKLVPDEAYGHTDYTHVSKFLDSPPMKMNELHDEIVFLEELREMITEKKELENAKY